MMRMPKAFVMVLAVGLLVALATPALAAEAKGKIKSITADKHQFVLTDENGKDWTFMLSEDGKVRLGDKSAKLDELKEGDRVTVTYEKKGDELIASEVQCKRE